jgi:hypothetical protein
MDVQTRLALLNVVPCGLVVQRALDIASRV